MATKSSINEILEDIKRRVDDKILEPTNAALLAKLIENADNLDEAIKIAELGTTYKRTGFHFDKRLEKQTKDISYFKKNETLSFETNKKSITHKLIIGDNYPALLNLLVEYRGKIDVIYIDPPYGKDNMGEFARTNYENAITRDNLLSMLYPRLVLARQLLSDTGVIFCSIDDKNQAYVKGLFDDVFEENNFIGTLIHQRAKGGGQAKHIVKGHDYVLVYSKFSANMLPLYRDKVVQSRIVEKDGIKYLYNDDILRKVFGKYSGVKGADFDRRCAYEEILEYHGQTKKDEIDKQLADGEIFLEERDGRNIVCRLEPLDGAKSKMYSIIESVPDDDMSYYEYLGLRESVVKALSEKGKEALESIGLGDDFDYPKPVDLIKQIIQSSNNKDAVVLDFFAGSGTTGQAVLELNSEEKDAGRQFILCTNNEVTDSTPNGIAIDVTSKRLKRLMTGKCYDGTNNFKWLEQNKPFGDNLLVVDLAEVSNFESVKDKTPFDVIDETLYGKNKMNVQDKVEWVCDNFEITQKREVVKK